MARVGRDLWGAMSANVVQATFDSFMKSAGFSKKSGSWYRVSDEVITVVELQKSQYGLQYYVNVALWLRALGEANAPKEQACHVRTRLSRLVGSAEDWLSSLLDLDAGVLDASRRDELSTFLSVHLGPVLEVVDSLDGLRSPEGQRVINAALVVGPARTLLAA